MPPEKPEILSSGSESCSSLEVPSSGSESCSSGKDSTASDGATPPITETSPSESSKRVSGIALISFGALMISLSGVWVKLSSIGPTTLAFYRMLVAFVALFLWLCLRRQRLWHGRQHFLWGSLAGLAIAVDLIVWHRSILYVSVGLATILGNFQVLLLTGIGVLALGERPGWKFYSALPLAGAGLFLLFGADWANLSQDYKLGVLFGLITAFCYAAYLLSLRRLQTVRANTTATINMTLVVFTSALVLGLATLVEGESFAIPDAKNAVFAISYGILTQVVGWLFISNGLPRVEASRAGLALLLQPALAFGWDILFFERPTTASEGLGAVMALAAIYMGSFRKSN